MLIGYMRVSTDNAKKPAVWAWNPYMERCPLGEAVRAPCRL